MNPDVNQPDMTVALTGGSGFVGRAVLDQLLEQGYHIRALDRRGKLERQLLNKSPEARSQVQIIEGDLFNEQSLHELCDGADAVIHLVGIIREYPRQSITFDRVHHEAVQILLNVAKTHGVKRWIHMSAIGTRDHAISEYHQTKWLGEEAVRASGLPYVIFRPSLILGPEGEFTQMLRDFGRGIVPPFMPYFGTGTLGLGPMTKIQPVDVQDVATVFVQALTNSKATGRTYDVGGPDVVTWPQMYHLAMTYIGRAYPKPVIPMPAWLAKTMADLKLPGLPFNRSQVEMSQEDSVGDIGPLLEDFYLSLSPLQATLEVYGNKM